MHARYTVPGFQDFRAEIDRLYPEGGSRIALSRRATLDAPEEFIKDIQEQLSPDIQDKIHASGRLPIWQRVVKKNLESRHSDVLWRFFCMIFDTPGQKDPDQNHAVYLFADPSDMNPRRMMAAHAGELITAFHFKFNAAATHPALITWKSFYHELCHAVCRLGLQIYRHDRNFAAQREEMLCDTFAALHMLRRFGDEAVPLMKTFADMRLSCFPRAGYRYYTAPAIYAVLDDYKAGLLDGLDQATPDEIFAGALGYAKTHYLDPETAQSLYNLQESRSVNLIAHLAGASVIHSVIDDIVNKTTDETPQVIKQRALFAEAKAILDRDYYHPGFGSAALDALGRLKDRVARPFLQIR